MGDETFEKEPHELTGTVDTFKDSTHIIEDYSQEIEVLNGIKLVLLAGSVYLHEVAINYFPDIAKYFVGF